MVNLTQCKNDFLFIMLLVSTRLAGCSWSPVAKMDNTGVFETNLRACGSRIFRSSLPIIESFRKFMVNSWT